MSQVCCKISTSEIQKFNSQPFESFQVPVEAEAEVVPGPLEVAHLVLHPAGQSHVLALSRRLVGRLPHELLHSHYGGGEGGGGGGDDHQYCEVQSH